MNIIYICIMNILNKNSYYDFYIYHYIYFLMIFSFKKFLSFKFLQLCLLTFYHFFFFYPIHFFFHYYFNFCFSTMFLTLKRISFLVTNSFIFFFIWLYNISFDFLLKFLSTKKIIYDYHIIVFMESDSIFYMHDNYTRNSFSNIINQK